MPAAWPWAHLGHGFVPTPSLPALYPRKTERYFSHLWFFTARNGIGEGEEEITEETAAPQLFEIVTVDGKMG